MDIQYTKPKKTTHKDSKLQEKFLENKYKKY